MTNAARIYGNSLYDLVQEEGCVEPVAEQLQQIRTLFAENPEYVRLLGDRRSNWKDAASSWMRLSPARRNIC